MDMKSKVVQPMFRFTFSNKYASKIILLVACSMGNGCSDIFSLTAVILHASD
jgi:hypothetical protein